MSEPTTEAGKALMTDLSTMIHTLGARAHYRKCVVAIEAEARSMKGCDANAAVMAAEAVAAALTALRAQVGGLDDDCHSRSGLACDRDDRDRCTSISRVAVLALIDAALGEEGR